MVTVRQEIRISDIAQLTGRSVTTAAQTLRYLKDVLAKKVVTIEDYCEFYGLNYETVCARLPKVPTPLKAIRQQQKENRAAVVRRIQVVRIVQRP